MRGVEETPEVREYRHILASEYEKFSIDRGVANSRISNQALRRIIENFIRMAKGFSEKAINFSLYVPNRPQIYFHMVDKVIHGNYFGIMKHLIHLLKLSEIGFSIVVRRIVSEGTYIVSGYFLLKNLGISLKLPASEMEKCHNLELSNGEMMETEVGVTFE